MSSASPGNRPSPKDFVRPVGRGDWWAGVAVVSVLILFSAGLLVRGLAPRGTLWGANEPLMVSVASSAGGLSGGSVSLAQLTSPEPAAAAPTAAMGAEPGEPATMDAPAPAGPAEPTPGAEAAPAPAGGGSGAGAAEARSSGVAGPVQVGPRPPAAGGGARQPGAGGGAAAPAAPVGPQSFLPVKAPAGYQAGAVQKFNAGNLYEKINGKADSYLDYGFVGLESQSVTQGQTNIDVYIYDMGTPLQAFGMLNSERSGTDAVNVGQDGYKAGGSVFFRADRYYTMIMVSRVEAEAAALEIARELAAKMPKNQFTPPGIAWFPKDGLVPGSIKWVKKKVASVEGLDDGYQATYRQGDEEVEVFLIQRADAGQLSQAHSKYLGYLRENGEVSEIQVAGTKVNIVGAGGGAADTLFQKGKFIGGTVYVSGGRAVAEPVTAKLIGAAGG